MKNRALLIGLIAVIAVISFRLGQRYSPGGISESAAELKVKNELIDLTKADFEEYQKLKGLEERYKKADEILGKIVSVFLADVGLRLGYNPTNSALLDVSCAIPGVAPAITAAPSPLQTNPTVASPAPAPTPSASPVNAWIQGEKKLAQERREEDALEDLKKMEIKDLFSVLRTSEQVSGADAAALEGHFRGEVQLFKRINKDTTWDIEWNVVSTPRTAIEITMTSRTTGKTFSRTRGTSMKDFTRPTGSKAIIVNVRGDDGYIQIYPLSGTDTWVGNYYGKKSIGEFEMLGQVVLSRVQ